jgi:hypothetical protein
MACPYENADDQFHPHGAGRSRERFLSESLDQERAMTLGLAPRHVARWIIASILLGGCLARPRALHAATIADSITGRWASSTNVSVTNPKKGGAAFFLEIVVTADGRFKGTWERYDCFSYPGAYGIAIVACQRSKKSAAVTGRLDAASGTGQIELVGLGKSGFKFTVAPNQKGQPQLSIDLPPAWLKAGDPVLYETRLFRT